MAVWERQVWIVGEGHFLEIETEEKTQVLCPGWWGGSNAVQRWERSQGSWRQEEILALQDLQFESYPSSRKPSMIALAHNNLCHLPSTA